MFHSGINEGLTCTFQQPLDLILLLEVIKLQRAHSSGASFVSGVQRIQSIRIALLEKGLYKVQKEVARSQEHPRGFVTAKSGNLWGDSQRPLFLISLRSSPP
jgi:hypothetical protein